MPRTISRSLTAHRFKTALVATVVLHACGLAALGAWTFAVLTQTAELGGESGVMRLQGRFSEAEPSPPAVRFRSPRPPVVIEPQYAQIAERRFRDTPSEQVPLEEILTPERLDKLVPATPVAVPVQIARAEVQPETTSQPVTVTRQPIQRTRRTKPPTREIAAKPVQASVGVRTGPSFAGNRPPRYPFLAKVNGWEGQVMLRITVAADGRVRKVEVKTSSGHAILDAEAVNTVRSWRGKPAEINGRPVETVELLPVRFKLQ